MAGLLIAVELMLFAVKLTLNFVTGVKKIEQAVERLTRPTIGLLRAQREPSCIWQQALHGGTRLLRTRQARP